jgi:hypothetical protein
MECEELVQPRIEPEEFDDDGEEDTEEEAHTPEDDESH